MGFIYKPILSLQRKQMGKGTQETAIPSVYQTPFSTKLQNHLFKQSEDGGRGGESGHPQMHVV